MPAPVTVVKIKKWVGDAEVKEPLGVGQSTQQEVGYIHVNLSDKVRTGAH